MGSNRELWEPGPHKCFLPHPWPQPEATSTVVTDEADWCPGGKKVVLEGTRLKCFEPEWLSEDTVVWVEEDTLTS